jgi:hypothetical protein
MKAEDIAKLEFQDWPLPEPWLAEIGRVAVLWSTLEAHLDVCLSKLAGFDAVGDFRPFVLLRHSSFPQKLDVLSALCAAMSPQFQALRAHKTVLAQLKTAQSGRNRFVHGGLTLNESTGEVELAHGTARGEIKTGVQPIELSDVKRASADIHLAMLALHEMVTGQKYPPMWERPNAK